VRVHDFLIKELGRAAPYGVYDLAANTGWVSVGVDHDTSAFAVQTIRRWWQEVGCIRYPQAARLVITADGGGSNGSRVRLWKRELQRLANELGIAIEVHHFPPGTSKWNSIEHRLFSFISQNWRAKPLVSYQVIIELIGATTTETGLKVRCELDSNPYPKGIAVSDAEMAALNIRRADFRGEWNYTILPYTQPDEAVICRRPLRRRLQPQILDAIHGFERLRARELRLFVADVGKRSGHDAHLVAALAPFGSEIERPIFHAMFQRASIVVDVKYIHRAALRIERCQGG
jgi:hypothetical protein